MVFSETPATPDQLAVDEFRATVWSYYSTNARTMPWRDQPTPYFVLVSEIMLQQTQVGRVVAKFNQFVQAFPDIKSLAAASLAEVLTVWSGLGYNRRANYLLQAAQTVMGRYDGVLPTTIEELQKLPGIGKNTAAAICCYAFGQPVVFIETNIRTVYLYHFFSEQKDVRDQDILLLVERTVDHDDPQKWYWALMDYGTHLKQTQRSQLTKSTHYKKQSKFSGSIRQARGDIIKTIVQRGAVNDRQLQEYVVADDRYEQALTGLIKDGLVVRRGGALYLTGEPPSSHNKAKYEII